MKSLYDPEPQSEEDLWFLPGKDQNPQLHDMPLPQAARETALDPTVWEQAEQSQYRGLIAAAEALMAYEQHLQSFPPEVQERMALITVAALLRGEGAYLRAEDIALYRMRRIKTGDAARDLGRASWAMRRLLQGRAGLEDLTRFLGLHEVGSDGLHISQLRDVGLQGQALVDAGQVLIAGQNQKTLHRLTQAAFCYALWRAEGITAWEDRLEPAVMACIVGGDPFLPMGTWAHRDRGSDVGTRLQGFYAAAQHGAQQGLMHLKRLRDWQKRADTARGAFSGRSVVPVLDAALRYPLMTADMTGVPSVSARRCLGRLEELGLMREVTGQGRYRVWAAVV